MMMMMKPKHPVYYFPSNKCKSGTRRSVVQNIDAFEVCDNGEWVFMLCAPGTWFDTEFMECTDGKHITAVYIFNILVTSVGVPRP